MQTTTSGQQATDSLNGKLTFEQDKNRIVGRDADNTPRLLILADGTEFVMKTSPEGIDVIHATDDELTFNSGNNVFKILQTDTVTIAPFNAAANAQTVGRVTADYNSGIPGFSPIVLGFTNSLPSGGLFLWQGVSPESTMSSPTTSPMGYIVHIRFDTLTSEPSPGITRAQFNATIRNSTASSINGITYTIKYFFLQETTS